MIDVKVLGTGCRKCNQLFDETRKAIERLGVEADLEKVLDRDQILSFGVPIMPALIVDGEVKSMGKVPTQDELSGWLTAGSVS